MQLGKSLSRLLTAATVALAAALAGAAAAQATPTTAELAERLLGPWGEPGELSFRLLPGALPSDLGFELPLPEGAELIGSYVRRGRDSQLLGAQVVLDSPLGTEETLRFFADALGDLGWHYRLDPQPTGFLPSHPNLSGMFCTPQGDAFLYLNAFYRRELPTDVRLDINREQGYNPCADIGAMTPYPYGSVAPLPTLVAPQGAEVMVHGGSLLDTQASSTALIEGRPLAELSAFYEGQLRAQGWSHADEGGAWSWRDEEGRAWTALLTLQPVPGREDAAFANVLVVQAQ